MTPVSLVRPALFVIAAALVAAPALAANCEDMAHLNLPNAKVDTGSRVALHRLSTSAFLR
jgi:hypothetical protein